jgi:hypothetical protein
MKLMGNDIEDNNAKRLKNPKLSTRRDTKTFVISGEMSRKKKYDKLTAPRLVPKTSPTIILNRIVNPVFPFGNTCSHRRKTIPENQTPPKEALAIDKLRSNISASEVISIMVAQSLFFILLLPVHM